MRDESDKLNVSEILGFESWKNFLPREFIDNNFGMPMIVGNKVRINALVTIIGVLLGGLCVRLQGARRT